jgi:hypothetical protein
LGYEGPIDVILVELAGISYYEFTGMALFGTRRMEGEVGECGRESRGGRALRKSSRNSG